MSLTRQAYLESPDGRTRRDGLRSSALPFHLEQLCGALVDEDRERGSQTLGPCLEYIVQYDVLDQLHGLCMADEPAGAKTLMLSTFTRFVRSVRPDALMHQSIARTLTKVLHHSIRSEALTGQDADDELLEFVCETTLKLAENSRVLALYVDLGSVASPPQERQQQPMLMYLLSHLHHDTRLGFLARTAALALVRTLLALDAGASRVPASRGHAYVDYVVYAGLPEALSATVSAAYALLPTHLHLSEPPRAAAEDALASRVLLARFGAERAQVRQALPGDVPQDVWQHVVCLVDCAWLVQEMLAAFVDVARDAHPATEDKLEQLLTDIQLQFRAAFLESVVHPSLAACSTADGSATAIIVYHAVLLALLDPRGVLTQMLCDAPGDVRGLVDITGECIEQDVGQDAAALQSRGLALQLAKLVSRRTAIRDAVVASPPTVHTVHGPPIAAALAAMLHRLQPSRPLGDRFLVRLYEAEREMLRDPVYADAETIACDDDVPRRRFRAHVRVVQQVVAPSEHILPCFLGLLRSFFQHPFSSNILLADALCALCRSPFVSLERVLTFGPVERPLADSAPVVTFMLTMLAWQAHELVARTPDMAFYLGQRRRQLLGHSRPHKPERSTASDGAPAFSPFLETSAEGPIALEALHQHFRDIGWVSPVAWRTTVDFHVEMNASVSHSTQSLLDGAQHVEVRIPPCPLPACAELDEAAARAAAASVPLLHVLDNVILLEELILELGCIIQLRQAWGIDRYTQVST